MLVALLDRLGIDRAHMAGNSLGARTALELAKLGRARSVVALAPAGLWSRGPLRPVIELLAMHPVARGLKPLAPHLVRSAAARTMLLGPAFGDARRVPVEDVVALVAELAQTQGFRKTVIASHRNCFKGGRDLDLAVTVAFGQRDCIVPASGRRRDELPPHVRSLSLLAWGTCRCGTTRNWSRD